jgi:hypothetical protein
MVGLVTVETLPLGPVVIATVGAATDVTPFAFAVSVTVVLVVTVASYFAPAAAAVIAATISVA